VTEQPLTADEIGASLRMHPDTVRRLTLAGKLPGVKVGGRFLYFRSQVETWLKDQAAQNVSVSPKASTSTAARTRRPGKRILCSEDDELESALGRTIKPKRVTSRSSKPPPSSLKLVQ